MTSEQALRNIRLYVLFQMFREPLFFGAILITYIQQYGQMSLSQIYLMESICLVGLMVLEIPSGAIADMLGRRLTVVIGTLINFIHILIMVFISSPLTVWISNIVWIVAFALVSGADTSLVYDSLKTVGQEERYRKIIGRSSAYRLYATAFCAIAVGYLAEINMRIPIAISAVLMLVPFVLSLFFSEPPYSGKSRYSLGAHGRTIWKGVSLCFGNTKLLWAMSFVIVISSVSKVWFFSYNPYFEVVNLPLKYYGWLFLLLNIVAAVSSYEAQRIHKHLGDFKSVVMMVLLVGVPILMMGMISAQWCVLLILLQNVVRGYMSPFMDNYQHQLFECETRATCASVNSAMKGLGEVIMLGAYGLMLHWLSVQQGLAVLGVFTLLAGTLLIWRFRAIS